MGSMHFTMDGTYDRISTGVAGHSLTAHTHAVYVLSDKLTWQMT